MTTKVNLEAAGLRNSLSVFARVKNPWKRWDSKKSRVFDVWKGYGLARRVCFDMTIGWGYPELPRRDLPTCRPTAVFRCAVWRLKKRLALAYKELTAALIPWN